MKKTIYFHIGFPKTGTTSLQSFCYKNSQILEENGFLYPVIEDYVDITVIINGRCFRRALLAIANGEFIDHSEFDIKVIVYMRNAYDQMISWPKDNYWLRKINAGARIAKRII